MNKFCQDEVFLVAEIGKNFIQTEEDRPITEYLENAKQLVDQARNCGANAVKFQTHELTDEQYPLKKIISPHFTLKDRYGWIERNTNATPDWFWSEIKSYTESRGLVFFSTPMSRMAAERLEKIGVPLWKIGSGDVLDFPLLDFVAQTGKPLIISSGMVSYTELDKAVNYLINRGVGDLTILYCVSEYPCPDNLFNLSTISRLAVKYPGVTIGFSDHSIGKNDIALAAVKLGARLIEKHFSLSRELWGADHRVSMTPDELSSLVKAVRGGEYHRQNTTPYLGFPEKELEGATNKYRPYFHKTLVAAIDIDPGTTVTQTVIWSMRPKLHLNGIRSQYWPDVLGRRLKRRLAKYQPLTWDAIE
ncbi:MAG: N-acetylneuraminate synthase family protein [Patescibacteria group bacterium]